MSTISTKKGLFHPVLLVIAAVFILSCAKKEPIPASPEAIQRFGGVIPKPVSVTTDSNAFFVTAKTIIVGDERVANEAKYLADQLNTLTGFSISVQQGRANTDAGNIVLSLVQDPALGNEGYTLIVTGDSVSLQANQTAGLFRGIQTLRQMLPFSADSTQTPDRQWEVATGTIRDNPTYAWRGSMLDVSRHFFSVDDVKRYIDLIALYKMNVLHLHLSDDQGWRIEIKSWPNLTTHGGSTEVGGGEGGFYTQEQYSDIVAYAASRHVMIVPEIDLPGHTNAALASYGELNRDGKPTKLYTGTEVGFSSLVLEKDVTFQFVDDVIRELAAITPTPYIHIGGDEAHSTKKSDYIAFINRFSDIVKKHGKIMVGWEEISQADIDSNAVAQHWASVEHAQRAVDKGAKVILSPSKRVYLDMKYDTTTELGLMWAALIEVNDAYNWDPKTQLSGMSADQMLGIEAPLWSETVEDMDDIEFLVFPRLPAIAEVAWTPEAARSWDDFKVRLGKQGPRMTAMGIDFYKSKLVPWE